MSDNIQGKLGEYKIIKTDDGSLTLFSTFFNEGCHSTAGAVSETIFNYIAPCRITERSAHLPLQILEVGFGLGIGVSETYKALPTNALPSLFISLEIDEELINWSKKNAPSYNLYFPQISELRKITTHQFTYYISEKNQHKLIILIGDATKTLPLFLQHFNYQFNTIYQDAFSPKQNPTLWSQEWFQLLNKYSEPQTILSTYSCAGIVRKNLEHSNWIVKKRPGFKHKREALIAFKPHN